MREGDGFRGDLGGRGDRTWYGLGEEREGEEGLRDS